MAFRPSTVHMLEYLEHIDNLYKELGNILKGISSNDESNDRNEDKN